MTEQQDAANFEALGLLSDALMEHDEEIRQAAIAVVEAARPVCAAYAHKIASLRELQLKIDRYDVLVGTRPGPKL